MITIATKDIADALGISRKAVLERAKKERWKYVKRNGGMYWLRACLPENLQVFFTKKNNGEKGSSIPTQFAEATEAERKTAKLKAAIINSFKSSNLKVQDFCAAFNSGYISQSLLAEYGKELTDKTFYRWIKDFKNAGVAGLTPLYSRSGKEQGAGSSLTETEKSTLEFYYLDYNKRSIKQCYLTMKANIKESKATYQTCFRYLKSLPPAIVSMCQDGEDKFEAKHLPYIERDKRLYKSMEQVQGDHHRIDRVVLYNGKLVIPWITSFIDVRSGAVLGWCVSTNPNSQTILAAYYMVATMFGIPEMVHVDNGKDYKGKTIRGQKQKIKTVDKDGIEREEEVIITGAIATCGSRLQYARAYHGQSKGVQERFYKLFEEYYSKNTGNYIGSNTAARVDEQNLYWRSIKGKAKRNDITEWATFVKEVTFFVHWYNTQWVSDAKGREGLTPEQAFLQNLPAEIKKVDTATLQLALTKGEVRTVSENGVRIGGSTYWAEELMGLTGQQVIARVNLTNRNEALICNAKGKLLCKAYADVFMETGDMEKDNEFVNRVRRDIRAKVKGQTVKHNLTFKPKNMLEIAMQASGVELPAIESYVPQLEDKKAAGAENRQIKKSNYISYYDANEEVIV